MKVHELGIGDKVRYNSPDSDLNADMDFGIGRVTAVCVYSDHVWVDTHDPEQRGWYHDYNLEVLE